MGPKMPQISAILDLQNGPKFGPKSKVCLRANFSGMGQFGELDKQLSEIGHFGENRRFLAFAYTYFSRPSPARGENTPKWGFWPVDCTVHSNVLTITFFPEMTFPGFSRKK